MKDLFFTFLGYLAITTGIYILYLLIFRKGRLPNIFSKVWFIVIMVLVSIGLAVLGWMLVSK
jgi:hypothetical protein